jgi:predicted dinucleotide-utilizing enzyme
VDRVKPERNLGAAKPSGGERRDEHPARKGFHHGTAVYGPVRTVVWEGRSREASPYPDEINLKTIIRLGGGFSWQTVDINP